MTRISSILFAQSGADFGCDLPSAMPECAFANLVLLPTRPPAFDAGRNRGLGRFARESSFLSPPGAAILRAGKWPSTRHHPAAPRATCSRKTASGDFSAPGPCVPGVAPLPPYSRAGKTALCLRIPRRVSLFGHPGIRLRRRVD